MVRGDRCSVGTCDNDTRYQERFIVKGHVQKLMFHRFPRNEEKRKTWTSLTSKGRSKNPNAVIEQLQRIQIQRCG